MKTMMTILMASFTTLMTSPLARAAGTPEGSRKFEQFSPDMPAMSTQMYYPDFWIAHCPSPHQVLMDSQEIATYNRLAFQQSSTLVDLERFPATLSGQHVRKAIGKVSRISRYKRYHLDGTELDQQDYLQLQTAMSLKSIPSQVNIRWGMTVRRTNLRTFPTLEVVTSSNRDPELDQFQETGINLGEPLAILHATSDGKWLFVQRFNYQGWVLSQDVGLESRKLIMDTIRQEPRLVVTGARVQTSFAPHLPQISRCSLDMGDSLPLATEIPRAIDGMGVSGNWVVLLPTRTEGGKLKLLPALISRNSDVNVGYLPMTKANIIRQAFKLQGERYGWGDAQMNRDCTGFVISVYRSFGLILPRNSSEHMTTPGLSFTLKDKGCSTVNPQKLDQLETGDAFESPTHAMLYLGKVGNEHYVIHDTLGATYKTQDGIYQYTPLRQITVTPLISLKYKNGRSMVDSFNLVRRFVLPGLKH